MTDPKEGSPVDNARARDRSKDHHGVRKWLGAPKPGVGARLRINALFWIGFVAVLAVGIEATKSITFIDPDRIIEVLRELINLWLCAAQLLGIVVVFLAAKAVRVALKWLSRFKRFGALQTQEKEVRATQRLFEEELLSVTINLSSLFFVTSLVLLFDRDFSWHLLLAVGGAILNGAASYIISIVEHSHRGARFGFKVLRRVLRRRRLPKSSPRST